jgi:hypothetical protein
MQRGAALQWIRILDQVVVVVLRIDVGVVRGDLEIPGRTDQEFEFDALDGGTVGIEDNGALVEARGAGREVLPVWTDADIVGGAAIAVVVTGIGLEGADAEIVTRGALDVLVVEARRPGGSSEFRVALRGRAVQVSGNTVYTR